MTVEDRETEEAIVKAAINRKNLSDPQVALMILLGLIKIGDFDFCRKILEHPWLHPETDTFAAYVYAFELYEKNAGRASYKPTMIGIRQSWTSSSSPNSLEPGITSKYRSAAPSSPNRS